jgi:hypothetical protein
MLPIYFRISDLSLSLLSFGRVNGYRDEAAFRDPVGSEAADRVISRASPKILNGSKQQMDSSPSRYSVATTSLHRAAIHPAQIAPGFDGRASCAQA